MSILQPTMFLISGPSAAGKSTVARLLAQQFSRGVHLEGDVFRRSIVTGREDPLPIVSTDAERQLRLRYEIAVGAADRYFAAGFSVVVEDVIAGPLLAECVALSQSRPLHTVVLLPTANVLAARDAARRESGYAVWSVQELHDLFATRTPRVGHWLDNSGQTPEETVDEILRHAQGVNPPTV
jgi:predicted kinase